MFIFLRGATIADSLGVFFFFGGGTASYGGFAFRGAPGFGADSLPVERIRNQTHFQRVVVPRTRGPNSLKPGNSRGLYMSHGPYSCLSPEIWASNPSPNQQSGANCHGSIICLTPSIIFGPPSFSWTPPPPIFWSSPRHPQFSC